MAVSRTDEKCVCPAMVFLFCSFDIWIHFEVIFRKKNWPCYGLLELMWHIGYNLTDTVFFALLSFFACFCTKSAYTTGFFSRIFSADFPETSQKKNISVGRDRFCVVENTKYVRSGIILTRYTTTFFFLKSGMLRGAKIDPWHREFVF